MAELLVHSRKIESIFQLLGETENDISYSIGYTLANSDCFLQNLLKHLCGKLYKKELCSNTIINLQSHQENKGFTDFELYLPGEFFILIEAKKGWILPNSAQLSKYASRKEFKEDMPVKMMVSLSECEDYYAEHYLPFNTIGDLPVKHINYKTISSLLKTAKIGTSSIYEKGVIDELKLYLNKLMRMQQLDSNWVYVVSVGGGNPVNWDISWWQIINRKKYFHPVGKRWPHRPPNYIAFRYDGELQHIHFIESFIVTKNLSEHFTEAPQNMPAHEPHFIYTLGPAICPDGQVKAGNRIKRSARVYCMLDTLLTSNTISDALTESDRRHKLIQQQ
jgi:hypothetical protein